MWFDQLSIGIGREKDLSFETFIIEFVQLVFHWHGMRMLFMKNGNIDRMIFDSEQEILPIQTGYTNFNCITVVVIANINQRLNNSSFPG